MAAKENQEQAPTPVEQKFSLHAYLGTKPLNRAEKSYYSRHFGKDEKELTLEEWNVLTGLK